jgi:hypothetical protein
MEDALRRAIVQVGDVASIAVLDEISLPKLKRRVAAGDTIQPAWGQMLGADVERYGPGAAASAPIWRRGAAHHIGNRVPKLARRAHMA